VALNKQVFRTRALTAVLFAVVMLAGLFINGYSFAALLLIIMAGCLYEFYKINKIINPTRHFIYLPLALLYIVIPILMLMNLGGLFENNGRLNFSNYYFLLPCAVVLSIWINDTMAYIVGSLIGKTPLSKISPKKTREGTAGGMILCIIAMALIGFLIPVARSIGLIHWVVIAAICAVFGTLGDLLESKIKRMAGLKDSGNFMPGHGGFLDRFDSLLISVPFVWAYLRIFLNP
jgi:phosphatidate cytidylyltransferase